MPGPVSHGCFLLCHSAFPGRCASPAGAGENDPVPGELSFDFYLLESPQRLDTFFSLRKDKRQMFVMCQLLSFILVLFLFLSFVFVFSFGFISFISQIIV